MTFASRRLPPVAASSMPENPVIQPLSGTIGAVVSGVQLNALTPQLLSFIKQALSDHLVLFFRNQRLDPSMLRVVAAKFGKPIPYPFVAGLEDLPEVIEVVKQPKEMTNFGGVWHSDTAYLPTPAMGALLYADTVPEAGGDTIFTNMHEVLNSLSPGLRDLLSRLTAVNDADSAAIAETRPNQQKKGCKAEHPVIRIHPETGKSLLYVNRAHTTRFSGMSVKESAPLLGYLFDQIEQPEFSCRFSWQPGSLAFWDNRACQHYPLNDYQGQYRRMLRVSLAGDKPIAGA